MREVGVLEAKTSFTSLIAEVERTGEEITVTRRGKAAVRIVPVGKTSAQKVTPEDRRRMVEEHLAWRDSQPSVPGFDDLPWDQLKRLARDEDDHD